MNNTFYLLSNDDILMFDKNTFTVENFKEILIDILNKKTYVKGYKTDGVTSFNFHILERINSEYNIEEKVILTVNQSSVNTVSEEIDCKLLKLGAASWKTGKLRFKAIADYNNLSEPQLTIEIELEFCPDQPELSETSDSTLDELRK
ncbi:KGK domain-containing protein [Planktothrix paucivesiculata]|uniref:KGK family protein n=1 Tax=Planktothrix paucivesiculata PCC 9631 TaxID=671071 RepID=A0A7Z9DXS8_9CYAN|nr:KGK domain-containing protein [Planktothrix paucivesiculata]VXD11772.1 putative KGK family protein [Planktothrix paucivesiculata PCC 9631]